MPSNFALNTTCVHKFSNSLMVNEVASVVHFHSYSAIPVTAFVFLEYLGDYFFFFGMLILIIEIF